MAEIEIRLLKTYDEMPAAVELQHTYWGKHEESVIPAHMLYSIATNGGHVLAAFDEERLVGLLVGFIGTTDDEKRPAMANLHVVSKRMVVLSEYRSRNIGYRLKLAQRDRAIQQGIRMVTWTFDPLMALNAHLNVRKLGGMCAHYLQDYYGTRDEGGLVSLGSSDRLLVEWWVTNRRVEERLFGSRNDLTLMQYLQANTTIINPTTLTNDGILLPTGTLQMPDTAFALVEIPLHYPAIIQNNSDLAMKWRLHSREVFQTAFERGYMVTDFLREQYEGRERAFYLFSYNGPSVESDSSFTLN